ncbi:thioredoxin domain-containing protein [Deinococcus sp.]|uniref:thioredoxin domain-containing protein n=1 Tax=Deinococcus sp. TaxID=47478 RepID=UPI003C7DE365
MKKMLIAVPLLLVFPVMAAAPTPSGYLVYTPAAFQAAKGERRVLFFHATWCPTCKAADIDIRAKLSELPEDVALFKTDYDKEVALKTRYGVTYQHTFVLVDSAGKALKKWNGGSMADVLANLKPTDPK